MTRTRRSHLLGALVALTTVTALVAGSSPAVAEVTPGQLDGSGAALGQQRTVDIAPGLDLTSFQRLQDGGWVTGHVMTADLSTPTLSLDLTDGGTVSGSNQTVSDMAKAAHAVAAVNGDYFDMNASEAPVGTDVSSAGLRNAGSHPRQAFTLVGGKAVIQALMSKASLTVGDTTLPIGSVNSPDFAADSIGLFNQVWGDYPIERLLDSGEQVRIATVVGGKVTHVSTDADDLSGSAAIPAGTSILVGRGSAVERLAGLEVGTPVSLDVRPSADVDLAVGGSQRLLTDGVPTTDDQVAAGRTAIGVSKDGATLHIVSIDGRQADSHGMTIQELAAFMADLGAWNAINLDGGGSTTLVARPAGTSDLRVIDRPSDGHERLVSNALVFRSSAPTTSDRVAARPVLQPAAGLSHPGAYELLPGLTRTIVGTRVDGNLAATDGGGRFRVRPGSVLRAVSRDRDELVVRGRRTGRGTVTYAAGHARTSVPLVVHGPMQRLVASEQLVAVPSADDGRPISLTAVDGDGYRVPVETRDVRVRSSDGLEVTPTGPATFMITAAKAPMSGTVTFTVLGHRLELPVTVGHQDKQLADFHDAADWTAANARASGTVEPGEGPTADEQGLSLDFDFTQSTATRGFYAVPPAPIEVPGQPEALTLWIKGTGKGEWPRLQILRGDGTTTNLDGDHVTWTGWRKVRFPVPAGTAFPITLQRIRFLEIRSDQSYVDHLGIADLQAEVPIPVDRPPQPWPHDPAVITNGSVDDMPQHIAVMSDTQFVARDPNSPIVAAGRRVLREIVAAKPDLLVIDGDFVDEGSPADIAFAKKILDEEVGDKVPYIYVPGNHEVMGGPITNFTSVFGPAATHRDLGHTRIITLDSSSGTLHPGGSTAQLRMLEDQLDSAATDPNITGVLVFNHHPVDDPHPDKASQLLDRVEAAALARTLTQFQATSGKAVAQVNGHVGVFFGDAYDGVTRMINGNSGKTPSGTAAQGGFTGWSMLGIDPSHGRIGTVPAPGARLKWLQIETHARVDGLTLTAPATMQRGEKATVTATITQDGERTVPVSWPVSAQWGGRGVHVVDGHDRGRHGAVVTYDPATGTLTALRAGTAALTVTVNGVSTRAHVTVSR